jgi:hypothetical protein
MNKKPECMHALRALVELLYCWLDSVWHNLYHNFFIAITIAVPNDKFLHSFLVQLLLKIN